ncbi:OmpA/MotB family protein [Nonlabens marinus]|uniref:Flagellar motor rotation protein MotB n=1 Tax=Nonlabens marinus S1-08 TaxID=1454201 RepID=W8VT26_9FLAO|nr:OmpA family protein [Nonlabens marinus]BAO56700.1 flagellar motor rotation protein MotB [Nonlabens marinus S1-08]
MKKIALVALTALMAVSCASKKDLDAALEKQQRTQELLDSATVRLNACLAEEKAAAAELAVMRSQVADLRANNQSLINNTGDLTTLSKKGAENLEKSLESLREKDMQIRTLNDAITRKDSVTLALVTSLKSSLGNLNDEDISINVEKGVVYVSISDKLLFASGSANINSAAKNVLGKVAKVVNDKPEIEIMVEGHTDNQPINTPLYKDNWALSSARAASVTRLLQEDFNVDPKRMTAAGRSYYVPVASNDTAEGRAKNRRTRIIVLPKLDQFFDMVEKGMEQAKANAKAGK